MKHFEVVHTTFISTNIVTAKDYLFNPPKTDSSVCTYADVKLSQLDT